MRIYVWNENTSKAGCVSSRPDAAESGDTREWTDGDETPEAIAERAWGVLATRTDGRPGGAGDAYAHKCARNVLRHVEPVYYLDADDSAWDAQGLDCEALADAVADALEAEFFGLFVQVCDGPIASTWRAEHN
ncbi:MAG: hypothetical protein ACOC8E_08510, partial [Planctomycetota bacterium]